MITPPSRKEATPHPVDIPLGEGISRTTSVLYNRDRVAVGTRTTYRISRRDGAPLTELVPLTDGEIARFSATRTAYLRESQDRDTRRAILDKAFAYARVDFQDQDPLYLGGRINPLFGCFLGEVYTRQSPEMYEYIIDVANRRFISDTYFREKTMDDVPEQSVPLSLRPGTFTPGKYTIRNIRRFALDLPELSNVRFVELPREDVDDIRTQAEDVQLLIRLLAKEGLFPVGRTGEPLLTLP